MSGPEYLALAWRLPAYDGVMAARIRAEQEQEEGPSRARSNGERRVTTLDDPAFAGLIDRG